MIHLLTYDEIIKYLSMYNYDKGNIIDKSSGEIIQDNELILKVKTAMLVYGIALDDVKTDIRDRGRSEKSKEKYIKTSMEKLGINGEINSFGFNKLINSILSSNGHYSETYSVGQNNLKESNNVISNKNNIKEFFVKYKKQEIIILSVLIIL